MAAKKRQRKSDKARLPFTGKNYLLFAVGLLFILLGFVLLSNGDISISPFLLVIGYCVFIPAGILLKNKPKSKPAAQVSGE